MSNAKIWLEALRLRTLPLALASTGMGNLLAVGFKSFNWKVCVFSSLTAILLQILSNLANDYGDYKSGADSTDRIGPQRGLQSGVITTAAMRNAIIFTAVLTLICGSMLLYESTSGCGVFLIFFIIGLACILAAIKYTMGKNPYGYSGLGDIAVFIFFGIVGVGGTFYLHVHYFDYDILWPASAIGLLCSGVLNINNMRDIDSDAQTGKNTLVVRFGLARAKEYHLGLMVFSSLFLIIYFSIMNTSIIQWLPVCIVPIFIYQGVLLMKKMSGEMDGYLKQLALSTLLIVICIGISVIIKPYVQVKIH